MAHKTHLTFANASHNDKVCKCALVDKSGWIWIDCFDPEIQDHGRCRLQGYNDKSKNNQAQYGLKWIKKIEFLDEMWINSHVKEGIIVVCNKNSIELIVYNYESKNHSYHTIYCHKLDIGSINKIFKFGRSHRAVIVLCKKELHLIEFGFKFESKKNSKMIEIRRQSRYPLPKNEDIDPIIDCCSMAMASDSIDTRLLGLYHANWSQFTLFLLSKYGKIYTICPIIVDAFTMPEKYLESLSNDIVEEEELELFYKWANGAWFDKEIENRNDMGNVMGNDSSDENENENENELKKCKVFNGNFNFVFNGHSMISAPCEWIVPNTPSMEMNNFNGGIYCVSLTYLDTHSIFSNYFEKENNIEFNEYLPIIEWPLLARTWSNGVIDIIASFKIVSPHWKSFYQMNEMNNNNNNNNNNNKDDDFDALVIEQIHSFSSERQIFGMNKNENIINVLFNNDEIIIGFNNSNNEAYFCQIELSWVRNIPCCLANGGIEQYVDLLLKHEQSIASQLKSINNKESNKMILMFLLRSLKMMQDKLVFYDSFGKNYKKSIISLLLASNEYNDNDEYKNDSMTIKQEPSDDNEYNETSYLSFTPQSKNKCKKNKEMSVVSMTSPIVTDSKENDEMVDILNQLKKIEKNGNILKFSMNEIKFPENFSLNNAQSLAWFVKEIKSEKFDKIILILQNCYEKMMLKQDWIVNQTQCVLIPQIEKLKENLQIIESNCQTLNAKMLEISENDKKMKNNLFKLQKLFEKYQINNNNQCNQRFENILNQFENDYKNLEHSFSHCVRKGQQLVQQRKRYKQQNDVTAFGIDSQTINILKESIKQQQTRIKMMKNSINHIEKDVLQPLSGTVDH